MKGADKVDATRVTFYTANQIATNTKNLFASSLWGEKL